MKQHEGNAKASMKGAPALQAVQPNISRDGFPVSSAKRLEEEVAGTPDGDRPAVLGGCVGDGRCKLHGLDAILHNSSQHMRDGRA